MPDKVRVFFFETYWADTDTWKRSRRRATLSAIGRLGGRPLMDTGVDIEPTALDIDGVYRPELHEDD